MVNLKQSPNGHIAAFVFQFWGHTKPLSGLLAKIVRLKRTNVTFFVALPIFDRVSTEVSKHFLPHGEEHLRELIRIVGLECAPNPMDNVFLISNFLEGYKTLLAGKAIPAKQNSNKIYEAIPPPQLVIVDCFAYDALKGVRSISGSSVPVYAWQSGGAAATMFWFGPEYLGGGGDLAAKLENAKLEEGQTLADIADKLFRRNSGKIVRIAGLPPMYDYEHNAQLPILDFPISLFFKDTNRFLSECDGAIHGTTPIFESDALALFREWYGTRPVIAVAPLSPPVDEASINADKTQSPVIIEVEDFMNKAFESHGAHSIIYISLGTIWWMKEPEKIWAVLDVLIELNIPFLFSHASPFAVIPDGVKSKIEASGLGLMATWLPQQMILRHPACGWFVTHCGHNSTMESLTEGVPLICWPFDADQPSNAAYITSVHDAGYELFEVRAGPGLRPIHRLGGRTPEGTIEAVKREATEVFTKARGDDGQRKRANAHVLSEAIAKSWAAGGLCWDELNKFNEVLH